jgi:hypothetical protein
MGTDRLDSLTRMCAHLLHACGRCRARAISGSV